MHPSIVAGETDLVKVDRKALRAKTLNQPGIAPLITATYTAVVCLLMYVFTHTGGKQWLNPC